MKIKGLKVENYKCLKSIEMKPEGALVVVGGKNGQGKSALLESFLACIGGKKQQCDQPVRTGEKKSVIEYDLGELVARLEISAKNGNRKLTLTNKEGKKIAQEQTYLSALYHKQLADPIAFIRQTPKEQVNTIKEMIGLDFTNQDGERDKIYVERTQVNRERKALLSRIDSIEVDDEALDEIVSITDLIRELELNVSINEGNQHQRDNLAEKAVSVSDTILRIKELERQVDELNSLKNKQKDEIEIMRISVSGLIDQDEVLIKEQIENAESINEKVRLKQQKRALELKLDPLNNQHDDLCLRINEIDQWKADQIANADMPYDGLVFDGDELFLNELPFSQASASMKRRVAISMLFNLIETNCGEDPIKVILLLDSPYLDEYSLKEFEEIANERNGQILIEKGGLGPECHIIIENGELSKGPF